MCIKKIFFLAVLFTNIVSAQKQNAWVKFSPLDKGFEVMVPGEMRDGQKKVLTEIGEINPTTWIYTSEKDKDPNFLYMVSLIEYPESILDLNDENFVKEFFNESLAQHLEDIKGELIYEADSPLGNNPSRVFRATWRDDDFVVRGRMILVKDRFYMLQVYTEKTFSLNSEAHQFMDSFKVKS